MKKSFVYAAVIWWCGMSAAYAAIHTEEIQYQAGDIVAKGYLAYDDANKAPRPGVLVVHEWWGHDEYARKRARMLAEMGYIALALDMYGDGKQAAHVHDAQAFSGAVMKNPASATARFQGALNYLREHPRANKERMAAIGYCFGGAIVLEMARRGLPLQAVASFHGSLGTQQPAQAGKIQAQILVLNGADDPFVSHEEIARFKQEMDAARAAYRFVNYPGAKHSFTNPAADQYGKKFNMPLAYHPQADQQSWEELERFLRSALMK